MKLSVYYHIWAPQDDYLVRFLVDEQIKRLQLHSLTDQAKLHVCVVGKASKQLGEYVEKVYNIKPRLIHEEESGWELNTLRILYEDCLSEPEQYVMYMHTKGLSHFYRSVTNAPWSSNVNTWRKFMEYVCIDKWRECVKDLHKCDATGMNLMRTPFVHYSGNFWWARGSHIATLKDPFKDMNKVPGDGRPGVTKRHNAEAWIGSGKGKFTTQLQIAGSMYSTQKFNQYKVVTAQ